MGNKLFIPTLKGCRDALRTKISEQDGGSLVLFNPMDSSYRCEGGKLAYRGQFVSEDELIDLVSKPRLNNPLDEPILVNAIFSFMYWQGDIRNNTEFQTTVRALHVYLGISSGQKGFKLLEKLGRLSQVFGVIISQGVFPLLEVRIDKDKLYLTSEYFQRAISVMLHESHDKYGERGLYYSDCVEISLLTERNKSAALITIELARIIATSGSGNGHITLNNLITSLPQLHYLIHEGKGVSYSNRQLKRAFNKATELLMDKTDIYIRYPKLKLDIPQLSINKRDAVIKAHSGIPKYYSKSKGTKRK